MTNPWRKIITKYISFLLFIGVLPLLAFGLLSYQISSQTLQEVKSELSQALLNDQVRFLELKLAQVDNVIANISGVEAITYALDDINDHADSYTSLATQARIGYILNGYLHLQGLVSIDIFTEGGAHYHVGDTLNVSEIQEKVKDEIRSESLKSKRQTYWAGVIPNVNKASNHSSVLAASKAIWATDRQTMEVRPIAFILVNYSLKHLYDHFSKIDLSANGEIVLIDQRKNIIYSHDQKEVAQAPNAFVSEILKTNIDASNFSEMFVWDDTSYLIQKQTIQAFDWQILNIIPEKTFLSGVTKIREVTAFLVFLGITIVGCAALFFSHHIVKPIRDVITGYKQLQTNSFNLEHRLPIRSNDEIGELVKWFNSFLDNLKARKTSEEALRESEERYALVASATNEGLWDWNLKSNEIYLSPRFLFLIGKDPSEEEIFYSPEEWLKLIHPDDEGIVKKEIDDHLAGNTPFFQCELRLQHQSGSYYWTLSRGLAVRDTSGQVIRMAGSHTDISARKEAESQLRHEAFHDNLTGLYNRAWLISYLQKLLLESKRHDNEMFAILFLDLDRFKIINDTLGHVAGDELLIQVSQRLIACLRGSDLLARFGGDEFVILLEHSDDYHFTLVAERILQAITRPFHIQGNNIKSGISIGITHSLSDYSSSDEMLRDADIAMYQAKKAGKNCYVIFDENMRKHLLNRISMEKGLDAAIKNDGLELVYQPIISLSSSQLVGFEALVRWHDKSLGSIGPDDFIPLAERCNLINPLGRWVLENTCRQWQLWKEKYNGIDKLKISINLSPLQFHDEIFLKGIPKTLSDYGVKGTELAFEITETAIIHETELAARVISEFKQMGISVHLDDFGTGYSSLSHLSGFSIDLIKIDRSFIQKCKEGTCKEHQCDTKTIDMDKCEIKQCREQHKQVKMVSAVINLAHELGIKCTAEGIEELAQQELLQNDNCDYGQGFYISKPSSAEDIEAFIIAHEKNIVNQNYP